MRENRYLKWFLIIQSFTPLFLLLIIKYWESGVLRLIFRFFSLLITGDIIEAIVRSFRNVEIFRCILILICVCLLVMGVLIYLYFSRTQTVGFTDHAERISVTDDLTETSIAFFVSYVIPMLLEDITDLKGFLCFFIIIIMMILLMRNTNLYYQNPILAILGYKTFLFNFTETSDVSLKNKMYIAITKGELDETKIIKRKYIADNVFLIYNKN